MVPIPSIWEELDTLRVGTFTEDRSSHPSVVPILLHWLLSAKFQLSFGFPFRMRLQTLKALKKYKDWNRCLRKDTFLEVRVKRRNRMGLKILKRWMRRRMHSLTLTCCISERFDKHCSLSMDGRGEISNEMLPFVFRA